MPTVSAIIPMHYEVDKGTLQSILEQVDLSLDNVFDYDTIIFIYI